MLAVFYVYDGLPRNITVDEDDRSSIFKAEMFGVVKLMGERLVLEYNHKYGLKYVILRFDSVYGSHKRCLCIIYEFIKEGLAGRPIVVWGKGEHSLKRQSLDKSSSNETLGSQLSWLLIFLVSTKQYFTSPFLAL